MITSKEREKIHLLSDNELYPQAVEFMRGIAKELPASQINGLLNVSLANPYKDLTTFVDTQYRRSTWRASERHIPEFYRRLLLKFKDLEQYAYAILALRQEKASEVDQREMKMAIAREFIQHVLAENSYMIGTRAFQPMADAARQASGPFDSGRSSWQERGKQRT